MKGGYNRDNGEAPIILLVDFRCRHSLSAGGRKASSSLRSCGVSANTLIPQESSRFLSIQQ
jgi:hypothetical protein